MTSQKKIAFFSLIKLLTPFQKYHCTQWPIKRKSLLKLIKLLTLFHKYTGELGYDGPLYDGFLHMTDDMLGPSRIHIKYLSYVYEGFCI